LNRNTGRLHINQSTSQSVAFYGGLSNQVGPVKC